MLKTQRIRVGSVRFGSVRFGSDCTTHWCFIRICLFSVE
jgi:hypothetical protein